MVKVRSVSSSVEYMRDGKRQQKPTRRRTVSEIAVTYFTDSDPFTEEEGEEEETLDKKCGKCNSTHVLQNWFKSERRIHRSAKISKQKPFWTVAEIAQRKSPN